VFKFERRPHGVVHIENGAVNQLWRRQMNKFLKDESGATAIEYGLIAAAMGLALVTAMPFITRAVVTKFTTLGTQITTPVT
jgi:pilus assembly protein Flp/PilA